MPSPRVAIVIPTLNASSLWEDWVEGMRKQTFKPDVVLVIDSSSDDGTPELAMEECYQIHKISRKDFNHGRTRQLAVGLLDNIDIVVFLTQDAVLAHECSIQELVSSFESSSVGAAYGRQLPRKVAGPFESHARLFNYPVGSRMQTVDDIPEQGIKAAFISNSFAGYRVKALNEVGGFPVNVIVSEDMHVAARMIDAGWSIHYNSKALVEHSHSYTPFQEFQRYFDVGVFHAREPWIMEQFGAPNGEGLRFVLSEFKYLGVRGSFLLPSSILRTGLKLIGFHLGKSEYKLPLVLKRAMSMQKAYWDA